MLFFLMKKKDVCMISMVMQELMADIPLRIFSVELTLIPFSEILVLEVALEVVLEALRVFLMCSLGIGERGRGNLELNAVTIYSMNSNSL
jgi:uncharacterized membrane protein